MARICLVTTGQPTTNPRLVKEADALVQAGHKVHVIAAYWAAWATEMDKELLRTRGWTCAYVGGDPFTQPIKYALTRGRYGISTRLKKSWPEMSVLNDWAFCRVLPELRRAAEGFSADLYIAHNLGALPAAVSAAERNDAQVGFDAEDFHSGELLVDDTNIRGNLLLEQFESKYLPLCDYITASSSGIARAYAEKYELPLPETIVNVFPLSDRPHDFRPHDRSEPVRLYWFSQTIGAGRGLEDVIQAMSNLSDQSIELHLRGAWQPGYESTLLSLAANCGVARNRIVDHQPEPAPEMVRLAAQYDVGLALEQPVSINKQLASSNKIFTYLLAGNAIIATRTEGQFEVMNSIGPAGYSYEPGDVASLARRLRVWCEDRAVLEGVRIASWECGSQQFNWDFERMKFLGVVQRTLSRNEARVGREQLAATR